MSAHARTGVSMMSNSSARMRRTVKCLCNEGYGNFKQFNDTTSIHGLKYITQNDNNLPRRMFWIAVFIGAMAFSIYFCVQMWKKWEDSPVLVTIENNRHPIVNVTFPAVTVCNVNKVSKELLDKALKNNPTYNGVGIALVQETLRSMTKLEYDTFYEKSDKWNETIRNYDSLNITPANFSHLLKNTSIPCNELVLHCIWLGKPINCSQEFLIEPTDDGYCCTFNAVIRMNKDEKKLRNATGYGYHMGLSVFLFADLDDYAVTNGNFDGFRVLIHDPNEVPDVADRGFVIGPGTETFAAVKIVTTISADEVPFKVAKEKRQCLVEGEHDLQYFKRYTHSGCMIECLGGWMASECKCRPCFIERNESSICTNWTSFGCLSKVTRDVRLSPRDYCPHCLPPCADVWYQPEVSYAPFPGRGFNLSGIYKKLMHNINRTGAKIEDFDYVAALSYIKENIAVLHVYIAEATGVRYKRDIRFGVEDFISAMGGLLGLGLGVSFISVMEMVYFMCLHYFFESKSPAMRQQAQKRNDAAVVIS